MKRLYLLVVSFFLSSTVAYAAVESTKGIMINTIQVDASALASAGLTDLSPAAIERGLKDAVLLAKPHWNEKNRVLELRWNSITKQVNGTEFAQALDSPLETRVRLPADTNTLDVGQKLTIKGDLQGMLRNFDEMMQRSDTDINVDNKREYTEVTKTDANSNKGSDFSNGSSGNGYLSEGNLSDSDDFEVSTEYEISTTEQCAMAIDWDNLTVSNQERVVKKSSETGNITETGACHNVGALSKIEKDFTEACSIQIDGLSGYSQGFKYYSIINGERIELSGCKYDDADGKPLNVSLDFEACSLEMADVNIDDRVYSPFAVKYTMINGTRYNLTECEVIPETVKNLPTKIESCEIAYDLTAEKAHEQERVLTYDPQEKNVLLEDDCYTTKSFDLERDYDVEECADLPNYQDKEIFLGFRYFYKENLNEKNTYLYDCEVDLDTPIELLQEVGTCSATESLVTNEATINKKWYFLNNDGSKSVISGCESSDEVYDIVSTQNTCSPMVLFDVSAVVLQERKGWQDSAGAWHYVTDCTPISDKVDIQKEVCDSPKYEHDFVGGQSYLRTRTFYRHNDKNVYLTECGRDTETSFAHTKSTSGCQVVNDDANLRSQLYTKVIAALPEGNTTIKNCSADTNYVPYSFNYTSSVNWNVFNDEAKTTFYTWNNPHYVPSSTALCEHARSYTSSWGSNFNYNLVEGSPVITNGCSGSSSCTNVFFVGAQIRYNNYTRFDSSNYKKEIHRVCVLTPF